ELYPFDHIDSNPFGSICLVPEEVDSMSIRSLLILPIVLPALVLGQSFTASVRGIVTDSSQAAVAGARVTVTDADRNVSQKTTTDTSGRYLFSALPPGRYSLDVEGAGFNKYSRAVFPLQVQQQATIDVELTVGAIATTVSVESSAP